jgi:hypothetical protein
MRNVIWLLACCLLSISSLALAAAGAPMCRGEKATLADSPSRNQHAHLNAENPILSPSSSVHLYFPVRRRAAGGLPQASMGHERKTLGRSGCGGSHGRGNKLVAFSLERRAPDPLASNGSCARSRYPVSRF